MTKPITDPHPIKFKYSRIVRPRISKEEKEKGIIPPDHLKNFKKASARIGKKDGTILPRPIQLYRWWFLFLKLALELEENNVELIVRNPHPKNNNKPKIKIVCVNKKKYKDWDLDQVLKQPFDKWWKNHKFIFVDEKTKVLKSRKDWIDDPNIIHLRVDKRRTTTDLRRDVDQIFGRKNIKSIPRKFQITGKPRPIELQNKYNALIKVMDEDKLTAKQIFKGNFIRKEHHYRKDPDTGKSLYSSTLSKIVTPAKELLLNVCDGHFSTRP
jgi:hypothetical protein